MLQFSIQMAVQMCVEVVNTMKQRVSTLLQSSSLSSLDMSVLLSSMVVAASLIAVVYRRRMLSQQHGFLQSEQQDMFYNNINRDTYNQLEREIEIMMSKYARMDKYSVDECAKLIADGITQKIRELRSNNY